MSEHWEIYADWNPWHGCTKISPGCKYCYVYRQDEMYGSEIASSLCRKTGNFNLPIKRKRDKSWKIKSGKLVFTCFTSDFLLEDADEWRHECWEMIKRRSDLWFYFFTKRIDRFLECVPDDWGEGYDNVVVGCTVENQEMADYRLPIFLSLPIKHKSIIASPLLTAMNLMPYLDETIEEVSVGGESGVDARPCDYDWVLALREQCIAKDVPFRFHQTGARFIKDGRMYRVRRCHQLSQAHKANIDYKIGKYLVPAERLAEETGVSAVPCAEVEELSEYDRIVYLGALYAGGVMGLKKTAAMLSPNQELIVATVGLADPADQSNIASIRNSLRSQVWAGFYDESRIYHLRGAIDYKHLGFKHRVMMSMLHSKVAKMPEEELNAEAKAMLETYGQVVDFVDFDLLEPLVRAVRGDGGR